jgi:hypothetical protein
VSPLLVENVKRAVLHTQSVESSHVEQASELEQTPELEQVPELDQAPELEKPPEHELAPEQEQHPQPSTSYNEPGTIHLSNYKRAANTASHCIFHICQNRDLHRVSHSLRATTVAIH